VLFCARLGSKVHRALSEDSTFSVNVLAGDHEHVARHFASPDRGTGVRSFAAVQWRRGSRTNAPVIIDATAAMECRIWNTYAGGDHLIYVGEVLALHRHGSTEHALVFVDGCYRRLARDPGRQPGRGSGP
jgi:flavin reductase (DIM6/NTAB) family NADH-FMN oxidoreductase RutF